MRLRDLFPWRLTPVSTEQMDEIGRRVERANVEDIERRGLTIIGEGHVRAEPLVCECGHYVWHHVTTSVRNGCFPPEGCDCGGFRPVEAQETEDAN